MAFTIGFAAYLLVTSAATGIVLDVDNLAVDYTRAQASSRIVYLHLTGATQAAGDVGTMTAREIKRYRERKQKEAEDAERALEEAEEAEPQGEEAEESQRPSLESSETEPNEQKLRETRPEQGQSE